MKINILFYCVVALLLISCNHNTNNTLVTEKIEYDACIKATDQDADWWVNNLEAPARENLINLIFDAAKTGRIKMTDKNGKAIDAANLDKYLSSISVQESILEDSLDTFTTKPFSPDKINTILFREKWMFNQESLLIEKKVNAFCLAVKTFNTNFIQPILWIYPDTSNKDASNLNPITSRIRYDVFIKNPENGKEWYENNLVKSVREFVLNQLFKQVYNDEVKAYDYFDKPLSGKEIKVLEFYTDTITLSATEPPYSEQKKAIQHTLDMESVVKLRFTEEWSINPKTLQFSKQVLGLVPMKENYSQDGSFRGYTPMFNLYFDDKYPLTQEK